MKINFNSITVKTVTLILLFSVAFIFFVTFVVKNLFTDSYMQLERDKVVLIAKQIAPPLALNLSYGFNEAITEISNSALINKNVLLIKIEDYELLQIDIFSEHNLSIEEHKQNSELVHSMELLDPATQTKLGKLTVIYSNDSYQEYMTRFNIWFFWGILGFTSSLLLLTYFLYKSLKKLSILDLSLKNFDPKKPQRLNLITSNRYDEISSISKSANTMIDNIINYLSHSQDLNSQLLESQVHLKDAQRMAKVGSIDYNVLKDELLISDEYYRILGIKLNTPFKWKKFLSLIAEDDYKRVINIIDEAILNGSNFSMKYVINREDTKQLHIQTKGKVRKKSDGTVKITAISMDITSKVENKKIIEKLAYFDALTGLANRTLLKDRMLKAIQKAKRFDEQIAVIFLDLDHFKLINDTLGHGVGDELLLHISNLLQTQIRDSDTLSRLGGDEFIILLPHVNSRKDVEKFALKTQQALDYKHTIGTHQLYVTSSIGVAIYPEHGNTSDELIRNADTAMYEAKNDGRNRYKIYSKTMGNFVDKQLTLEQDLTDAVKTKDQIQVYYQPKIDAKNKKIIGAEALVRWQHPKNGLIFPDEFIFIAESTGIMVELGNIIIEKSIAAIKEINTLGIKDFKMAINLSARQFQDSSLVPFVSDMLYQHAISPSQVEFEITESISMSNMENTLRILKELRELGVSIAIDDFGTGHSSLAYLKKFPINTLKIDKSFVMDITIDDEDRVIAETIITMAHSLALTTVAEGVETSQHVEMLESMGCDTFQGYYYSKPVPKDRFIASLKETDN